MRYGNGYTLEEWNALSLEEKAAHKKKKRAEAMSRFYIKNKTNKKTLGINREQLKAELKEELRKEHEEEYKKKLEEEQREKLKAELKEELWAKLREDPKVRLEEELRAELKAELREELVVELMEELKGVIKSEIMLSHNCSYDASYSNLRPGVVGKTPLHSLPTP